LTVHSRVAQCRSANRGSVRFGYSLIRVAKAALALSMGLFAGLAAAGNLLDSDTNMAFVVRVLSMDTVSTAGQPVWHAVNSHLVHQLVFWLIAVLERIAAVLCLWGSARLVANLNAPAVRFNAAKGPAVHGLTLGIIL